MDRSKYASEGMVVTPHHLASQSALAILKDGGTAMEAMVSAAATISVVYPHKSGLGGDGFWLIIPPSGDPLVIEACGSAGSLVNKKDYTGLNKIPITGSKAAITVAGAVGGWREALNYSIECGYKRKSISKLLADAIRYAEEGFPVTLEQETATRLRQQSASKEFSDVYIPEGRIPKVGQRFVQPKLAETFKKLVADGLESFYNGDLANTLAAEMSAFKIPITVADLAAYNAVRKVPLRLLHEKGELYNLPPPTQGLVSLFILGILDHLKVDGKNEGKFIHYAVEATKLAFEMRDKYITDPDEMKVYAPSILSEIPIWASKINSDRASDVGKGKGPGDTVWMGIIDKRGFCVSYIQSLYHEFGSGVLLPETGVLWHNRGITFSLKDDNILQLKPRKKPCHTLNPAAAKLHDGRIIVYGSNGGDGQPQFQTSIFHRYVVQEFNLQSAVSAPRWLYGRSVGEFNDILKLEGRFSKDTIEYLKKLGHKLEILPEYSEMVGHSGAIVKHPDGMLEGAADLRGNGSAVGF